MGETLRTLGRTSLLLGLFIVIAVAVSAGLPALAQGPGDPDRCTYNQDTGETTCEWDDSSRTSEDDEPWWAQPRVEVGLAVVGLLGSVAGGGYAAMRIRHRRQRLRIYLSDIEAAYRQHKTEPVQGLPVLAKLRRDVHEGHHRGGLSDSQFLELDDRLESRITRLRSRLVRSHFSELPQEILGEVEHILADGSVSAQDVAVITELADHQDVATQQGALDDLIEHLEAWAGEDASTL